MDLCRFSLVNNSTKSHFWNLGTKIWPLQTLYPPLLGIQTRISLRDSRTFSTILGFHTIPQIAPVLVPTVPAILILSASIPPEPSQPANLFYFSFPVRSIFAPYSSTFYLTTTFSEKFWKPAAPNLAALKLTMIPILICSTENNFFLVKISHLFGDNSFTSLILEKVICLWLAGVCETLLLYTDA